MRAWWRRPEWLLLVPAALYALCLRAYYVGFFNDDAFYIIGARALLRLGRYVELHSPDLRPFYTHPPGYAWLLAPWGAVTGDTLLGYQLLSVALTLAAVWLVTRLAERPGETGPLAGRSPAGPGFVGAIGEPGLAAAAAFALNPATVTLSGVVLSEVPFIAFSLATLALARRRWEDRGAGTWVLLGLLAGYVTSLRLSGLSLVLALGGCLLLERRWREAALAGTCSAAVFLPHLVRVRLALGQSETRIVEMLEPYGRDPVAGLAAAVAGGVPYYVYELFGRTLFRAPGWLGGILAALAAGLAAWGLIRWGHRGWRKLPVAFFMVYVAVHLLWPYRSGRYAYPALPLACVFLFAGAAEAERRLRRRGLVLGLLALSVTLSAWPVARAVRASLSEKTDRTAGPQRTAAWIRENTPPEGVFAANYDGRVYLLTGRRCLHLPSAGGAETLRDWLRDFRVDYVLAEDLSGYMRRSTGIVEARRPLDAAELEALLGAGARAFAEPAEGTVVFRAP
ncbi:MAG: hypothetical protein HY553_12025 [Elusimicrobia bacterium]|nr:hypothetical protein [Elusimicrobiota bacterium]